MVVVPKEPAQVNAGLVGLALAAQVEQGVDGTDNATRFIAEQNRMGPERNEFAVRPLGNRLAPADIALFLQGNGHRTFVMRHCPSIEMAQLP